MRNFAALHRRITAYVKAKQQAVKPLARLPYLVKQYASPPGLPADFIMKQLDEGRIPLSDFPGYEQANQEIEQQYRGTRIKPKTYLNFNPDELFSDVELTETVAIEETLAANEVIFQEWLGTGLSYPGQQDRRTDES